MPDVVTFDPTNLLIIEINTGLEVNEIDWIEIYSEWKVWAAQSDNLKYPPAFRVVGGDPISDIQNLGSTFFLLNPWKFRPAEYTHQLTRVGNTFRDPAGESFTVPTLGGYTVLITDKVSNLVDAAVARLDLSQLLDAVYIDTMSGSDAGAGTNTEPVQTVARAFELAALNSLTSFSFRGDLVLDRAAPDWTFAGQGELNSTFDPNGYNVAGSRITRAAVSGAFIGEAELSACKINGVTNFSGVVRSCGFASAVTFANNGTVVLANCFSEVPGTGTPIFTVGSNVSLNVRFWSGGFDLRGMTAGCTASIDLAPGRLVIDPSCVGGMVLVRGITQLDDNSAGATVVDIGMLRSSQLDTIERKVGNAIAISSG